MVALTAMDANATKPSFLNSLLLVVRCERLAHTTTLHPKDLSQSKAMLLPMAPALNAPVHLLNTNPRLDL